VSTPAPSGDVNVTATPIVPATGAPELPDTGTAVTPSGTPVAVSLLLLATLLIMAMSAWKFPAFARIRRDI
jgi:hypothetical protein